MSGPLKSDSNSGSDSDAGAASCGSDNTIAAVVDTIARTAPEIRDGLVGRRKTVDDEENPSGETQVEADVWADELLEDRLSEIDGVTQYASEEREDVLECSDSSVSESDSERSEIEPETNDDVSGLSVAIDPLDGSSNLASNNPIGTIFGLYDVPLPARGRDLVAAGYVCYGPITTMVVATDDGVTVSELTGDTNDGGRRLLETDARVPEDPTVYGFGGRVPDWPGDFRAYAREIGSELKLRYGGAMVADVNQMLTYGGIFSYPGLESQPEGKLRLQFEGNPIGYIVERAGGQSSNGEQSLLDVEPTGIHQRTPVHVGSGELIERLEAALE